MEKCSVYGNKVTTVLTSLVYSLCFSSSLQVVFQVALAVLEANQERLLQCKDDGEAMMVLCGYLENIQCPFATVRPRSSSTSTGVCHVSDESLFNVAVHTSIVA